MSDSQLGWPPLSPAAVKWNAERAAEEGRKRLLSGPELLTPVLSDIDRLALVKADDAPDEMFAAVELANGVLCGLSAGPGLGGLDCALGRLYGGAETPAMRLHVVYAAALIRHWLTDPPGSDYYCDFDKATHWCAAAEIAAYRAWYPRIHGTAWA
jgi:hypothetical protein